MYEYLLMTFSRFCPRTQIKFQHFGLKWSQWSLWFKRCFTVCVSSERSAVICQEVWVQWESTLFVVMINLHMCTFYCLIPVCVCLFKWLYMRRRIWIFWLPNQTFVFEDMWFRQDLLTTLFILCICTACSTTWTVALKQLCGTKGQRKLTHQNISKCQWNFSNNTARTLCNWQYRWLTNKRKT